MVACPLSLIILDECVHLIKCLPQSVELRVKAGTQMNRSTMSLRSRENTYINAASGERLHQLKLIVYF